MLVEDYTLGPTNLGHGEFKIHESIKKYFHLFATSLGWSLTLRQS